MGDTGNIDVRNLTKHFGPIRAVDDISFKVERGEVFGFLGPNGAGKSTTMKMITGFITPTSGTVTVLGHDVQEEPMKVKERTGYLPESAALYPDMTVISFLNFIREVRGLDGKAALDRVIGLCHLDSVLEQKIETLSKGYKRRVALAQAIMHDPEVLIMDEPTDGLDPNQKEEVRNLIREMSRNKIIILSTHILEEVDAVCSRAVIISGGRIRFDGTPEELRLRSEMHNAVVIRLQVPPDEDSIGSLRSMPSVRDVEISDDLELTVFPVGKKNISHEVVIFAREKGWEIEEVSLLQGSLNEVFRKITQGGQA